MNINSHSKLALLYSAWLVALISVGGSLYASEILSMSVCKLCWFQRIALYPTALILGIAVYTEDKHVWRYVTPLCAIGFSIALYQYLLQQFPALFPIHICDLGPSCYEKGFNWLGFISFPLLSLITNCLIGGLCWLARDKTSG